ncbi:outer membrane beta-barrel protein [Helicobacter cetorum]|uniref:outer membrane beta-barrel protein n=1 Tax=Helicobacter cetorum TaxID=138563 RepID=UPI0013157A33|nr:outer membrane beta-barrel protein [Helicobacter cetorum]
MKERITKEVRQEIIQKKAEEKAKEKALHDKIMQEELKKEVYQEELKKANQQDKTPIITDTQAKPIYSHSQYEKIFSHQEVSHENIALKKEELNKDTQPKQQQIAPKPSEPTPQKTEKPLIYSSIKYDDRYDYADKDSFYLGIGYEYGSATTNGGDIVLGYKWVGDRENTKWSGARVGVFASGSVYMSNIFNELSDLNNCLFNACPISTSNMVNQALQNMNVGFSNYGVYSDWLINAYNGDRFFAGFRIGGALAGSTYFSSSGVMGNFFQFFVNLGLRIGFSRHAFEFVAKLPTVTNKFDIEQDGYNKLKIPQNYLFGFNYVYSFK